METVITTIQQQPVSCVIAHLNRHYDCNPKNIARFKSRFSKIPLIGLFDSLNIDLLTDYIKSGVDRLVEEHKWKKVIEIIQDEVLKNCYIIDWKEFGIDIVRCSSRMQAALKIIKEKYINLRGVPEVSEEIGITPESLSRLFKNNIDLRPKQLITLLKLNHAIQLMQNSDLNINEIATIVGYKDDRRFRENFKHIMGICPSKYRYPTNSDKKSISLIFS